jgi:hypothetical protein
VKIRYDVGYLSSCLRNGFSYELECWYEAKERFHYMTMMDFPKDDLRPREFAAAVCRSLIIF